ncbi:MAG: acyltransferase [Micavibrio aeruginosavorus]|uniref:Acyltransferase n=1 Tax=Micavibrio aeruginosavorus TaxID=349221 RepID=A0A2W5MVI9_9BACT|nr:MAG: acyltransferase [Micavibrio aeruginosavorus]
MTTQKTHLGFLDGLRGLAALWVLVGHLCFFNQLHIPLISSPEFAVDLFILISGFLMYYHAALRNNKEPMNVSSSWFLFWIRRFFRIAPLFYVALLIGFLIGPAIVDYWAALREAGDKPLHLYKYTDHSMANILSHVTFAFGLMPDYHDRSSLPDWSIGLEMQFYALFPFMFLAMQKWDKIKVTALMILACVVAWILIEDYMRGFPLLPSLILLKLNLFLSGMLVAAAYFANSLSERFALVFVALMAVIVPLHFPFGIASATLRILFVLMLAAFALHDRLAIPPLLSNAVNRISCFLGRPVFQFLGDASYGCYLLHFFVAIPVCGWILINFGDEWTPMMRMGLSSLIVIPASYALAWLAYLYVEKPGIAFGKLLVKSIGKRPKDALALPPSS